MVGWSFIPINYAKREHCTGVLFTIFVPMTELPLIMKNVTWSSKSPSIILNQSIILMQFCNPAWHTFFGTLCALLPWPTGSPGRGSSLYTIFRSLMYSDRGSYIIPQGHIRAAPVSHLPFFNMALDESCREKREKELPCRDQREISYTYKFTCNFNINIIAYDFPK